MDKIWQKLQEYPVDSPKVKIPHPGDYPFFPAPEWSQFDSLWEEDARVPLYTQRGMLRCVNDNCLPFDKIGRIKDPVSLKDFRDALQQMKSADAGVNLWVACGPGMMTKHMIEEFGKFGIEVITRSEGQFFFSDDYLDFRQYQKGMIDMACIYHNLQFNTRWYLKFPASMNATMMWRDGSLSVEYYGTFFYPRRDLNCAHPAAIQLRWAYLRELVAGKQVFHEPIRYQAAGHFAGIFYDNAGNGADSFDLYSRTLLRQRFRREFAHKIPQWVNFLVNNPKHQQELMIPGKTPDEIEKNFRKYLAVMDGDLPTLWIDLRDPEIRRFYERFWAEAFAGYYAWNYRYMQKELAPLISKDHIFVLKTMGGSAWGLYVHAWPTADAMTETLDRVSYSNKRALVYKLGLAASNGTRLAGCGCHQLMPERVDAESLATQGFVWSLRSCPALSHFRTKNLDLFHNARPGAKVAVLYHVRDGIHHSQIANLHLFANQLWNLGVPFEVISERHLSPKILKQFDVLILPGFQFSKDEETLLKKYVIDGGSVLALGDNITETGECLACVLADAAPWKEADIWQDFVRSSGKGKVALHEAQVISNKRLEELLDELGGFAYRLIEPKNQDVLVNVLCQPNKGLSCVHLVNFTEAPVATPVLRVPAELAGLKKALWIEPEKPAQSLSINDQKITLPSLGLYGIVIVGENLETIAARNIDNKIENTALDLKGLEKDGQYCERMIRVQDVKPNERLIRLHSQSGAPYHTLEVNLIAPAASLFGLNASVDFRLRFVNLGGPPGLVQIGNVRLIMQRSDGYREEVLVPIENARGNPALKDLPGIEADIIGGDPTGKELEGKEFAVTWKPQKSGVYQAYLGYRYNNRLRHGRPGGGDMSGRLRHPANGDPDEGMFFCGIPKLRFEEKLPRLVIKVAE